MKCLVQRREAMVERVERVETLMRLPPWRRSMEDRGACTGIAPNWHQSLLIRLDVTLKQAGCSVWHCHAAKLSQAKTNTLIHCVEFKNVLIKFAVLGQKTEQVRVN